MKTTNPLLQNLIFLLLLSLFLLAGCGQIRTGTYVPPPANQYEGEIETVAPGEYRPVAGKGAALFRKAEKARKAGKLEKSEMLLERALRIEPHNPDYWYSLARVKYNRAQYSQTIQFCLKAESLAANRPQVTARSRALLRKAQRAMAKR